MNIVDFQSLNSAYLQMFISNSVLGIIFSIHPTTKTNKQKNRIFLSIDFQTIQLK